MSASASSPAPASDSASDRFAKLFADTFKATDGPGDARPTALQVVDALAVDRALYAGAVVLITGASSGVGVETARAFLSLGAQVYLPVRNPAAAAVSAVVADLSSTAGVSAAQIHLLELDLSSLQSVRACAAAFLSQSKRLNLLINNAGVMATPQGATVDGFETQFGTNHLGHFLLTQLLLPTLQSSSTPALESRVISLSSSGHQYSPVLFDDYAQSKRGYNRWVAYGQSKTANIYLATEIERRFGAGDKDGKGVVHALSVHPGFITTNLTRHMGQITPADLEELGVDPAKLAELPKRYKSIPQGAATTVWAALNPDFSGKGAQARSGKYCEDCHVALPQPDVDEKYRSSVGYAPHVYDEAAATRLWDESLKMVGL